jgi:hypothetical protein
MSDAQHLNSTVPRVWRPGSGARAPGRVQFRCRASRPAVWRRARYRPLLPASAGLVTKIAPPDRFRRRRRGLSQPDAMPEHLSSRTVVARSRLGADVAIACPCRVTQCTRTRQWITSFVQWTHGHGHQRDPLPRSAGSGLLEPSPEVGAGGPGCTEPVGAVWRYSTRRSGFQ